MLKKIYLLTVIFSAVIFISCKTTPESTVIVASVLPNLTSYPYLGIDANDDNEKTAKTNEMKEKTSLPQKEINTKLSQLSTGDKTELTYSCSSNYAPYTVKNTDRGKVLVFNDKILFPFQGSSVNNNYINTLLYVKSFLKDYPNAKIIVEGHTDKTGKEKYNYELSLKRASSVIKKLTSIGVKKSRLIPKAVGEKIPEYEKTSQNRRAEFIIIDNNDDLKKYDNFMKKL